jgi:hypothetical protein
MTLNELLESYFAQRKALLAARVPLTDWRAKVAPADVESLNAGYRERHGCDFPFNARMYAAIWEIDAETPPGTLVVKALPAQGGMS